MLSREQLRAFVVARIADLCGLSAEDVTPDKTFEEFGLSSRDGVLLAGELEVRLGWPVPATVVWEFSTVDQLVAGLSSPRPQHDVRTLPSGEDGIAVVGLGCRLPGGVHGPARYWDLLREGVDAVTEVPAGRWELFGTPDAATTRYGGFLDDVAGFDAEYFGIAPHEAELMDPQQRMLLEVAWEALEHAGLRPRALAGSRTGVFVGISGAEYAQLTTAEFDRIEGWTVTGAASSIAANRLSYLLDVRGPSMSVDTACSSSLVAVHLAVRSLRGGESDLALAGGVNVLLSPLITQAFDQAGASSPDGRCRAFAASANGMVRGEGCGLVVLKRLGDARRDGDEVLAVIRGSAVNSDGRSNGLAAPNVQAQRAVLRDAYLDAGIDPSEAGYVEAHGTGTPLGDPIEAAALSQAMCVDRPRWRPLLIGSAKTNLGHLEAAAGVAGLIKVVLALRHRHIPASLHFDKPSPYIDFAASRLRMAAVGTSWPRSGKAGEALCAGASSFGFGGTNAHVVVQEADTVPVPTSADRTMAHFVVSDERHAGDLASWLDDERHELADVAYTLARRGSRRDDRIIVLARERAELRERLIAVAAGRQVAGVVTGSGFMAESAPVWVFSGYQASWQALPRLVADEPLFAGAVDAISPVIERESGFSLRAAVLGEFRPRGPRQVMPLFFGLQVALARLWQEYGVHPAAVIGHSVGEVAAAVTAGGLSVEDGARVVVRRSALLSRLVGRGAMAVLGVSGEEAATFGGVHVAVYSAPEQCVVTGDRARISELAERVEARGLFARVTGAEGAGHSPLVDPLLPELLADLSELRPTEPGLRCYSTSQPDPSATATFGADYWTRNIRRPVRFVHAIRAAVRDGHRVFTEVSAHPVLSHALADTVPGALVTATLRRDLDPAVAFHTALATLYAHGRPMMRPAGRILDVPRPAWRHVRHWVSATRNDRTSSDLLGTHTELPGGDRHVWRLPAGHAITSKRAAEMALAAGAQILDADALAVRNLWLSQPPSADPVTTTFDTDGRFSLHSQSADGWRVTATAQVDKGEGALPTSVRDKLFEVRWQPGPLPAATSEGRQRWVLLGDCSALAGIIRRAGDEVTDKVDRSVAGVVLVLDTVDVSRPAEQQRQVWAVLDAVRLVAERPVRLWVSGNGGALRGAVRVLAIEHPALHPTVVDPDANVENLFAELRAGLSDDQVEWRDGVRYVARLARGELGPAGGEQVVRPGGGYLITGGLGGLGLATARWLAESGAGRIVLNGRSGPTSQTEAVLAALRETGCDVVVATGDLAVPGVATRLVDEVRRGGMRLRGVVHAAGTLNDRLALDVDEDNLRSVWAAKVHGGWQLHLATVDSELDWWVAYSSAAAMLGSPGQFAYACANSWLDALVRWRRARGLAGTSVGWGAWTEIGGAAESTRISALRPIVPAEGIEALHALLAAGGQSAGVFKPRAGMLAGFPELAALPYFAALADDRGAPDPTMPATLWSSAEAVCDRVRDRMASLVGYELDRDIPLVRAGIDSLVAMRMKNVLEHDFGVTVPANVLLRGASLADVEAHIATALGIAPADPPRPRIIGPRDTAERLVMRAFEHALDHGPVGVRDDLFALGATAEHAQQALDELRIHVDRAIELDELRANPTAERLAGLVRDRRRNESGVVRTLRASGDLPALYLAHPAGNDTAVYRELVSLLDPRRPCYGLDRIEDVEPVTDRATRYADLVTTPSILGGWSFGGVLAIETARIMHAKGDDVDLVVLIDSGLPLPLDEGDTEERSLARRLIRFGDYLTATYGREVVFDEGQLSTLDDAGQLAAVLDTMRESGVLAELGPAILRHNLTSHIDARALERYQAGPYAGRVVLFRATEPTPWRVHEPRIHRDDETLGWAEHCSDLTLIPVPGHHLSLLDPPGVHLIADHLRRLTR